MNKRGEGFLFLSGVFFRSLKNSQGFIYALDHCTGVPCASRTISPVSLY